MDPGLDPQRRHHDGLAGGFAEVAVILVGPFLGMPLPLNAAQILWVNMLTHGLPGVAFGGEPLDDSVMRRPSLVAGEVRPR